MKKLRCLQIQNIIEFLTHDSKIPPPIFEILSWDISKIRSEIFQEVKEMVSVLFKISEILH